MKNNIEEIVQELLQLDPGFAAHESEIRTLIAEFVAKKPDSRIDEAFVQSLRARLLGAPTPSPLSRYLFDLRYVVPVLAVLLALPFIYTASQGQSGGQIFAMNQEIQRLGSGAYGTLTAQQPGLGGSPETRSSSMPMVAEDSATGNYATAPAGMGGGTADMKMMLPPGPITIYSYVYKGEPLDLSGAGDVYNRVKNQKSSGQIASQLRKFNFGLVDLGAYSSARVRSFELVEDKPYGYSINVSFDEGTISINPNYTEWPSLNYKDGPPRQVPMSQMPSDDEIIQIAESFLSDHNISRANFGDPIVQKYDAPIGITAEDAASMPAPEQVTVTFPLKIAGSAVYEDGGYPHGLQVGVSVIDKRVMSVNGLNSQTFTSSTYTLEASSDKILAILGKGGIHAWQPQPSDGITINKVEIEVGTPQKVLMHTYNYKGNESQELYVPALMFPVTKAPAGEQYYPKMILIPLVSELLDAPPPPVM